MLILRDTSPQNAPCVVALGNFDGLHRGHQAVLRKTLALAREAAKPAFVLTFEPHPRRLFRPELPPLRILPFHEKMRRLAAMGMDGARVIRFTRAFSLTTPQQFVTDILLRDLRAVHVVSGEDFIFGHNREGNAQSLRELAAQCGMSATFCAPVMVGSERCSSTRIRAVLEAGNMKEAEALLGRPYSITGRVVSGDKRGRELGFPTANIYPVGIFTPATGIYAVRVNVRGAVVNGVASLGLNPTFGGTILKLESYLFDWREDIYGERIEVQLIERIREERTFDSIEALKAVMREDSEKAKAILR